MKAAVFLMAGEQDKAVLSAAGMEPKLGQGRV